MNAEARLAELGLQLPPIPKPAGIYKPVVVSGNMSVPSTDVAGRPGILRIDAVPWRHCGGSRSS